jgi:hypothetical protein
MGLRVFFCVLQHPIDVKIHNIPPREQNREGLCVDQVVGRQKPAHHHESPRYCSDTFEGCVQCLEREKEEERTTQAVKNHSPD